MINAKVENHNVHLEIMSDTFVGIVNETLSIVKAVYDTLRDHKSPEDADEYVQMLGKYLSEHLDIFQSTSTATTVYPDKEEANG